MKTKPKGGQKRAALPTGKKRHEGRVRTTAQPKGKKRRRKSVGRPLNTPEKVFGLPVVEAKENALYPLLQVDVDNAEKYRTEHPNEEENFLACVLAQMGKRVCGTERVRIERTVAYIAFPGEGVTKRYLIDKKSREILEAWDKGEDIQEGVEVRFRAPNKAHTLAALAKKNREYTKKMRGVKRPVTERKQRERDPLHEVVRNGNLVRWS